MKKFFWSCVGGLALCSLASASITPVLTSVTAAGSNFNFNYTATLAGDQRLDTSVPPTGNGPNGTYFTIYDINGFTSATAAPAGWTASTQLIGLTPTTVNAPDTNLINVSFIYTGPPTAFYPPGASQGNPVMTGVVLGSVGAFVIGSSNGKTQNGFFSAQATSNSPGTSGNLVSNFGPVLVPAGVPEPASMLLIGSGLIGLALVRRKLIRK